MAVAALYVESGGVYCGVTGIDPWDVDRDARLYKGPLPVVAHPPCKRWGRYWSGGPSAKVRRLKGDDDGCFAAALWAVRTFGGVLEHPEASAAWDWFGLSKPEKKGGWVRSDAWGWSCCVEQGHYGHRARKATWLYACEVELKTLVWGAAHGKVRLDSGYHSREERKASIDKPRVERITAKEMLATPIPFRDLLIELANTVHSRP